MTVPLVQVNCPACRPRLENEEVCENCQRILQRGICMIIFYVMEAGFGAAMGIAIATHVWTALGIFVFATFSSAYMVIKEGR